MRLPEFIRSTTFRWTLVVSGAFAVCIFLLFGFIYWQTAAYMTVRVDNAISNEVNAIAADPSERRLDAIDARVKQDPRRVKLAGLFSADGRRIAGNVESLPPGLQDVVVSMVGCRRGRRPQLVGPKLLRRSGGGGAPSARRGGSRPGE